jgi:hypothetical protein
VAAGFIRRYALDIVVFTGVILVGLARLPDPFFGDQALNTLMANVIAHGGAPYRDLWDLKHPGVFFFFAAGGALFGFNEIGIHFFELMWMVATALAVRIIAGRMLTNRTAASLAPALTVGMYYAFTTNYHATQTEALLGLPLLLSLIAIFIAVRGKSQKPQRWLFGFGAAAGVVLVFKAPYVLLPGLFFLLAVVEWRRTHGGGIWRGIRTLGWPVLTGFLIPVSATVVYLASRDVLGLAWWTFVDHPRDEAAHGGINPQRLEDSVVWFARTFRVPLILAIVGAWDRLRRGWELLTASLVAWVGAGVVVISVQVISWWPYHFLVLLVPIGLLAAQGVETLWVAATGRTAQRRTRVVAAASLVVVTALLVRQAQPVPFIVTAAFGARPLPFDTTSMRAYEARRSQDYANFLASTSFLRNAASRPGPIYVFGNPDLYLLAGRRPAIPLLIWGTSPPVGQWDELLTELRDASPPYIFVSDKTLQTMVHFIPQIATESDIVDLRTLLDRRYRELQSDADGSWYVRADLL